MKTVTTVIIETPAELITCACKVRCEGDISPSLPQDAMLVFQNDYSLCTLGKAPGFELSEKLANNPPAIIAALAEAAGLKCHIT